MNISRNNIRRITSVLLVSLAAVLVAAAFISLRPEESHAAVSKAAKKKAKGYKKAKNKLFKVKGAWYCFSRRKVRTGLQKVGKNYYFFTKSNGKMLTKTGEKKIGSSFYYFRRKSGKAPAVIGQAVKQGDRVWFYQSSGKRYDHSYLDTGSADGNTAAGVIISGAGITPDTEAPSDALENAYTKIVKDYTYTILIAEAPESLSDIGKLALAITKAKGGKCYNYAALTYVTFRALGAEPTLTSGKFQRNPGGIMGDHAWVTLPADDGGTLMYDSNQDSAKSRGTDFFGKKITYQDDSKAFTIEGQEYIYYPEKSI